jgi:hypothetical protein
MKTKIKNTIKYAIEINPKIIDKKVKTSSKTGFEVAKYKAKEIIKHIAKNNNLFETKLNLSSLTLTLLKSFLELFCFTLFFFTIFNLN